MLFLKRTFEQDRKIIAKIEGLLILRCLTTIKDDIGFCLIEADQCVFDLSGVTHCDAAGLQMLTVAKKESARLGKKLKFIKHSRTILDMMDLFGTAGIFKDKIVLSKEDRVNFSFRYGTAPENISGNTK